MRMRIGLASMAVSLAIASMACSREVAPATLDTANTLCGSCRMAVSDVRFAAQIAAPGAEPVFFDDIGCLRDYLVQPGLRLPEGAVAFVADHRTREWTRAADAVYTNAARITTPMGSGLIAHADDGSRRQDADTAAGTRMTPAEVFGAAGPPKGAAK